MGENNINKQLTVKKQAARFRLKNVPFSAPASVPIKVNNMLVQFFSGTLQIKNVPGSLKKNPVNSLIINNLKNETMLQNRLIYSLLILYMVQAQKYLIIKIFLN